MIVIERDAMISKWTATIVFIQQFHRNYIDSHGTICRSMLRLFVSIRTHVLCIFLLAGTLKEKSAWFDISGWASPVTRLVSRNLPDIVISYFALRCEKGLRSPGYPGSRILRENNRPERIRENWNNEDTALVTISSTDFSDFPRRMKE